MAKTNNIQAGLGKIPPQAIDLEEAVLGALLIEKDSINEIINILNPTAFYKEAHSVIFKAILSLYSKSEPIDLLTVTQKLRSTGELDLVGGPMYVTDLTTKINSSANIEYHARIIQEKAILRDLIVHASDIFKSAYDESTDPLELMEEVQNSIYKIAMGIHNGETKEVRGVLKTVVERLAKAMQMPDGITGIPSGFTDIDRLTGGWQRSDLIIIAARPGMGKTAFVVNNIRNTAMKYNLPVAMFSLEMSAEQLVTRMVASEVDEIQISSNKIVRGKITEEEFAFINKKIKGLAESKIFIDDCAGLTINQMKAKCRTLKTKYDIQLIVVDYIQLMSGSNPGKGMREQEIAEISRGLKNIAKSLNVPVIALSQLSRAVETRGGDKRPILSDLRESGAIEQDADVVSFLYRPEYYNITEDETGQSLRDIGEFIIAKHRNGPLETILLSYISQKTKFQDLRQEPMTVTSFYERDPF
jgi:replicative DNA helicase